MGDVRSSDVDGGWAWVALVASVLTMGILAAFDASHGIFQAELQDSFSGSQGLAALIFSLALGGRFLLGPVSGVISDLVTHRAAIMIGGALLCSGMAAASLSNDLVSILFFLGIGCGTGSGLSFTASVTVVSNYFHKYRTLAFGISLAAPGLGLVCGPYLLRWLIVDYGWRFTMVCMSGLLAQICVLGALYFTGNPCFTCGSTTRKPLTAHNNNDDDDHHHHHHHPALEALQPANTDPTPQDAELQPHHHHHHPKESLTHEELSSNGPQVVYRVESEVKNSEKRGYGENDGDEDDDVDDGGDDDDAVVDRSPLVVGVESGDSSEGILTGVDYLAKTADKNGNSVTLRLQDVEIMDEKEEEEEGEGGMVPEETFRERITQLLSKKFLWVVCLNQLMMTAGFATSLNFFPAYMKSVGVAFQQLPTLYTVYGITLIVTRVAGGFIFNRIPNHLLKALFAVELGFALVQVFLPLYGLSFQTLLVERFLTGMMYGASLLFVTPILDRSFGPKNLPVAFGTVMLCSGVGSVAAPPIAGVLYDIYGTYNVCCYLSGSAAGISALSVLLCVFIKNPSA